jgi:protoheme IX farnesyltransferase
MMGQLPVVAQSVGVMRYVSLAKPRMVLINVLMVVVGGLVAHGSFVSILWALVGSACVIAGACVSNNVLDRTYDVRMVRTMKRALPVGDVTVRAAVVYGTVLAVVGIGVLVLAVSVLTAIVAAIGFVAYVFVYTAWLKPRSTWSTSVGGIAGAIPPVIGYTAGAQVIDGVAWLLFALLFLWQPPHFWALAIYKRDEYAQAQYPLLPVVKGVLRTKIQMIPYVLALFPVVYAIAHVQAAGMVFFIGAWVLIGVWLVLCVRGFFAQDELRWAVGAFRFSLIVLVGVAALLVADTV